MHQEKRRDLFFEHILKKESVEDIFKATGYMITCGVLFKFSALASKEQSSFEALGLLITYFFLVAIALAYFAMHVAIPIDKAIQPRYIDWKNRYKSYSGLKKGTEYLKQKILIDKKVFYLALALWHFWLGNTIGELFVNGVLNA